MRKFISVFLILSLLCMLLAGCGAKEKEPDDETADTKEKKVKMGLVIDRQQVTADPFQYLVWKGLVNFGRDHEDVKVKYLESAAEKDYLDNFNKLAKEEHELIFGAGFLLGDSIKEAAEMYEDVNFVLLDNTFADEELADNLAGVDFASEAAAFLVGYIAANATETGKVGFIGGISSAPLDRFEFGYRYGVSYAAKELGKGIEVVIKYTDTFLEQTAGKSAAEEMYGNDCDVIFQAAGECGLGVIEAAKNLDRWVIGVDVDQYELATENVLTSALKNLDKITKELASKYIDGENIGGKNYMYGLEEEAVGIPKDNPNLTSAYPGLYEKVMELGEAIKSGQVTVPVNQEAFDALAG